MYGGLFGDLPPTKEQQQQGKGEPETNTQTAIPVEDSNKNDTKDDLLSKRKKEPPSIIRQLGTSGTAVAFVPAAARRRNLKRPASHNNNSSTKNSRSNPIDGKLNTTKSTLSATTSSVGTWVSCPHEIKQQHDPEKIQIIVPADDSTTVPLEAAKKDDDDDNAISSTYTTKHTHRSDRYDPFLPNDLLEYWERKAVEETWRVQEAEQVRWNQAEQLRRNQEQKRQSAKAEPPRGRGRGLSNLPAWMVEQQRRQEALGSVSTGI